MSRRSILCSAGLHGAAFYWLVLLPRPAAAPQTPSRYRALIAPHERKLVWYRFQDALPAVAPAAAPAARKLLPLPRTQIAATARHAPRGRQFVWQPAPKIRIEREIQAPNLIAFHMPAVAAPPKPKNFAPPPAAPRSAPAAPLLTEAAPVVAAAASMASLPLPRKFIAPPDAPRGAAPEALLPDAPPPPVAGSADLSVVIAGLAPSARIDAPIPEGARAARFGSAPGGVSRGAGGDGVDGASIVIPGLAIVGRRETPSLAALARAAVSSAPAASPLRPRGAPAPEPFLEGRYVYALSIQMPNVTSYDGSWMLWFAEKQARPGGAPDLRSPVALRKVDPKYIASAAAERVEGRVRLAAVIGADGRVAGVTLLKGIDERLDSSAADALRKWEFEPARREGVAVPVDAVVEIPFRLRPVARR